MNRLFKRLLCLGCVLPLLLAPLLGGLPPARAAVTTADLVYLSQPASIAVSVSWTLSQPSFTLLGPDGKTYDPAVSNATQGTVTLDGTVVFIVKNARAGQWKISYDKMDNEYLTISVDHYDEGVWITEFSAGPPSGASLPVTFSTEYQAASNAQVRYTLSVVTGEDSGGEKTLSEGWAYVNQIIQTEVSLYRLTSGRGYRLKLYLCLQKDDMDIFDFTLSEPFDYVNPNSPQPPSGVALTIHPETGALYADWTGRLPGGAYGAMLAVYRDAESEPYFFMDYDYAATSAGLGYDTAAGSLTVELLTRSSAGIYSAPLRRTIDLKTAAVRVEMPQIELTREIGFEMAYFGANGQTAEVRVNDAFFADTLTGDGVKLLTLTDGWNDIAVTVRVSEDMAVCYERRVFVDRQPPALTLLENYENIHTTDSTLVLVGIAGDCVRLTIGGVEVALGADGAFLYEAALNEGLNEIRIVAADALDNLTSYTVSVTRGREAATVFQLKSAGGDGGGTGGPAGRILDGFLPLAVSGGAAVVAVALAVVFWKGRSRPPAA